MAIWQKVFSRRNWQNRPSTATPLNETNLNVGDAALDTIDDRVIELNNRTNELEGYETAAAQSAAEAAQSESNAEAWAVGQRDGTDVPSGDPTYHNNAKYYSEVSEDHADDAHGWADNKGDSGSNTYDSTHNAYYWASNARNSESTAESYKNSCEDAVEQINTMLTLAEFDVDANGNLIYTDNSAFAFSVDNNGYLNWEVE